MFRRTQKSNDTQLEDADGLRFYSGLMQFSAAQI